MRRKAIWAVLPLVAVFVVALFWWVIRGQDMLSGAKETVAAELARAFGTKVTVDGAELTAWNVVTLRDLNIYDPAGRAVVKIPETSVEVDPLRLLWTRLIVESIGRVAINSPEINLYREQSGKLNIDDMLKQDLPQSRAFRGKLTITAGQVFLHEEKRLWQISPVAGSLDFAQNPAVKFRLTLREQDRRARMFGTATPQGQGVVTLQGENQDLESWQGLFPRDWPFADLKGRLASLDVTLQKDNNNDLKYAGEIKPAGVSGNFAGISWTDVEGFVTFSEQLVRVYYTAGKVNGQPLAVWGTVRQPMGEPELQLQVKASGVDPAAFDAQTFIKGKLAGEVQLHGIWRELNASGKLMLEEGSVGDVSLRNFSTRFFGKREGAGWSLHSTGGKGSVAAEEMQDLAVFLNLKEGRLLLETLTAKLGTGTLAADGLLGPDALDINVLGASIPLAALARTYPALQVEGRIDFNGKLTGSPEAMRLSGAFLALGGQAFHQPFTRAMGRLTFYGSTLSLEGTEVDNGSSTHQVSGSVAFAGSRAIDMKVRTRGARAEDLVAWLAPGEPLTGNIDNEVTLGGTLDAIEADGRVTLREGSYRGYLLSSASGTYRRSGGMISVQDFEVDSFNARAKLTGTIDRQQRLDFSVVAQDVEIAYIQIKYPYPVKGKLSLTGTLSGTTQNPEFSGEVTSRTLRLNGQDLFDIAGNVVLRRDEVDVSAVHFLLGTGQIRASGGYREKGEEIFGGLSVENTEAGALLSILNTPVSGVTGRLNGQVAMTGTTARPAIQVFGTLNAGKIKGYALDSIDLDVSLRNNVITVNEMRARQGTGFLVAKGTADMKGPLAMEIGGKEIDAGLLAAWLDTSADIQGKLNFVAQIGGTAASPQVGLSLDIRNGGLANATFDELDGLFSLKDEVIQVNQLYITKGEHKASLYGTLPLKALNREGRATASAADSMDLRLRLDQANLSILPLLSPEVEWASGQTQGEVQIGGTLARPVLGGRISVTEGAMKLKSLMDPLEKLGIDIQFEDDKINVNRVSGSMGGGTALLVGTASLNGQAGITGYSGKLTLERLGIRHKYFKGPLNGELVFSQKNDKPTLAGRILFEKMTMTVPGLPEAPQSNLDVAMDIDVVVGKDVRAYAPSLYDIWLGGGLHLGGTVKNPRISGKIDLVRGTVDYLGTRFRIAEGTVDFPRLRSLEPQLHLEALASFSMTKIILTIDGPASQMELKLSSPQALSAQDIRTIMAMRPRSGDVVPQGVMDSDALAREEMRALLTTGLRMQVFGNVENTFRDALGLDDFRLVYGTRSTSSELISFGSAVAAGKPVSLQEAYSVEFSKYLGDKVEVSYSMGLSRSEYLATVRYDVTPIISFSAAIDEKNVSRWGMQFRLKF